MWAGIVVDHIIWPQQHPHLARRAQWWPCRRRGGAAVRGLDAAERQLHGAVGQQPRLDHHALTDEAGDEGAGRPVVDVVGRVPLLQSAGLEDADTVGHGKGLVLVMRHQQCGSAALAQQLADLARQAVTQLRVEVGEGLVHQDQVWFGRERACQRHTLLLSAGELMRPGPVHARQPDHLEPEADAPLAFGRGEAMQAEADVVADTQVREQGVVLEHHADAALFRRYRVADPAHAASSQQDLPRQQRFEASDAAQRGGLATTRWPEQAGDAAAFHAQVEAGHHRPALIAEAHRSQFELVCHCGYGVLWEA